MQRTIVFILLGLTAWAWQPKDGWRTVVKSALGPSGANPYFILTPGLKLHYARGKQSVVSTVLNETRTVDGVEARVIEDRETRNGKLVEVTRDYYAADRATNDVYYMGEDVDVYKDGKVVGHGGTWLSGEKGARFGMIMPGVVQPGQKFHQEVAPGVAMDRAEVVATGESVATPAGTFQNCVKVRESNPLEKGRAEYKWYAPGVGLVKGGDGVLVKIEKP